MRGREKKNNVKKLYSASGYWKTYRVNNPLEIIIYTYINVEKNRFLYKK